MKNNWQLQDAKSRFSELIDRAIQNGAQVVTRRGRKVVVVLPYEEYERMTRPNNLANFFMHSPLSGASIDTERDPDRPRNIEIEP